MASLAAHLRQNISGLRSSAAINAEIPTCQQGASILDGPTGRFHFPFRTGSDTRRLPLQGRLEASRESDANNSAVKPGVVKVVGR